MRNSSGRRFAPFTCAEELPPRRDVSAAASSLIIECGALDGMRESDSANGKRPRIDAVFLTPSVEEFEKAWLVLKTASIRIHPAASVEQAQSLMIATDARVLLVQVDSLDGGWEAAAEMIGRLRPPRALVVAGPLIDEHFWISALEGGAFDVVLMPFEAEELRRVIENAHAFASAAPVRRRTWAEAG